MPGASSDLETIMNYKSVMVTRHGGPEVLQIVENDLRHPVAREVCIKILAAAVTRPDVTVRSGKALYTGTPLDQKLPFVPGYAVIGDVASTGEGVSKAAVGDRVGVLTVTGGYAEYLYWRSDRLIPVPAGLDPAESVTLILNYLVAYQTMHRLAKIKAGEKALIIGASGGIGTALLQLGQLAGLKMYAMASRSKHPILVEYGATPIEYQTQDFVQVIRRAEPEGLDVILDGMMRLETIQQGLSLLRRGGRMVSFGEPASLPELFRILGTLLKVNLLPDGKSFKLYGTSSYFLFDRRPFLEDWVTLFRLLGEGKIKPVIAARFPLLEAAKANALLESGQVVGNVVLCSPEWLS
jgi:NADPH:quinone reductase-like Zn-dependent oxidoreductase